MKKKVVIYLVRSPLTKRDFSRFGIQSWINFGWKVRVFDITRILYPKLSNDVDVSNESVDFDGLIIFQKIDNLFLELNNLKNKIVFIDFLGVSIRENRVRSAAKAHGVIVDFRLGSIPNPQTSNILEKISLLKKPITFAYYLLKFLNYNFEKILAKKYFPDYRVVGGTDSIKGINDNKTSIIKAHNFDYDLFLKKKYIRKNKESNFLVFLDEDTPHHSDYKKLGIKPYVTEKNYYLAVNLGLSIIAKSLKLDIKIAAHPRSNYENKQIKYQFPIIKGKTFELIRNADVVIGHSSTAIQWAVLMKKPIILVITNEIQNDAYAKNYLNLINSFATQLGKKIINLENLNKIKDYNTYLSINKKKYKKFIETYVKTKGSPEKLSWDIVIENIERDLQF